MPKNKTEIIIQARNEADAAFKAATKDVDKFARKATGDFGKIKKSAIGLKGAIAGIFTAAALYKIKSMTNEWGRLAGVQEQAEAAVRQAMISMGRYSEQAFIGIKNYSQALQAASTFGDEAILQGTKFLLTYKQIPDTLLPRTMQAMVDLAALMKGDMRGAANMMGKAAMGLTGELRRAGITVDGTTFKSQGFLGVLKEIENQVRGQARVLAETDYGQLIQFKNEVGDTGEEFGKLVNTIKLSFLPTLKSLNKAVDSFMKERKKGDDQYTKDLRFQAAHIEDLIKHYQKLLEIQRGGAGVKGKVIRFFGGISETPEELQAHIDRYKIQLDNLNNAIAEHKKEVADLGKKTLNVQAQINDEAIKQADEATREKVKILAYDLNEQEKLRKKALADERNFNEKVARLQAEATASIAGAYPNMAEELEQALGDPDAYFGPIIKAQSDASKQMMELSQRTADAMEQNFSDLFFDVMTGEFKSLGDYARAALRSIQRAAADVLGQIAKELIVKGIANLFTSGFAGGFGGGGFASAASLAHQGGIVGQTSMPTILAPSSLFANAPRLHSGLARDEFPAILQKGETVIPRNQAEASITNININAVDSKSFMDMVKRNPGAIITTVNQHLADGGPLRNTIREAI